MGRLRNAISALVGRKQHDPMSDWVAGIADAEGVSLQTVDISSIVGEDLLEKFPSTWRPEQVIAHYTRWQYACATVIAETAMMVGLNVVRMVDDGEELDEEHPLNQLIETINPLMTKEEFVYLTVADCVAVGRSYWEIVRDGAGDPVELWPIIGTMKPRLDRGGKRAGVTWVHEYQDENGSLRKQTFGQQDIVYFRTPKPGTVYGSMGTGQACAGFSSVEDQLVEAQWRDFRRGINPALLLAVANKKFEDPRQRQAFMEQLQDRHMSVSKRGGVMAIPGEISVHNLPKANELAYAKSSEIIRDHILAMHRVPGAMLGLSKDVNRASAEALQYAFAEWRVKPMLALIEGRINQDLAIASYPDDDVRFRFEDPTPANREAELAQQDSDLRNGVRSINEVRMDRGLPEVEWGNTPILPLNMVSFGEPFDMPDNDSATYDGKSQASGKINQLTKLDRMRMAMRALEHRREFEVSYALAVAEWYGDIEQRVLEAWDNVQRTQSIMVVQDLPEPINRVLDPEAFAWEVAAKTADLNERGVFLGGDLEQELDGFVTGPNNPWAITDEFVRKEAARFDAEHFADPAQTVRKRMSGVVQDGIGKNLTWDEIKSSIVTEFGRMKESQAATVAMTETTRLYNGGASAFRRKYGIDRKQWVCSFVNSRDSHIAADGTTIPEGDDFVIGTGKGPYPGALGVAEEDCNCACMAIGVVD